MNFETAIATREAIKESLKECKLTADLEAMIGPTFHSALSRTLQRTDARSEFGVGIGLSSTKGYRLELRAFSGAAEKLALQIGDGFHFDGNDQFRVRRILPGQFSAGRQTGNNVSEMLRQKIRPPSLGAAIGNFTNDSLGFGSMGPLVTYDDKGSGFLTCSHVLLGFGSGQGHRKDEVSQPPSCLSDSPDISDVLGEVKQGTRLYSVRERANWNKTDAALVEFDSSVRSDAWQNMVPTENSSIGKVLCADGGFPPSLFGCEIECYDEELIADEDFLRGIRCFKLGAGSGYTEGTLTGIRVPGRLSRNNEGHRDNYFFSEVFEIEGSKNRPFSVGGDSGSLVCAFNEATGGVIGLGLLLGETEAIPPGIKAAQRTAKSRMVSYATPMDVVFQHFATSDHPVEWKES